ncbi:MAG: hypothetical protein ABR568_06635 [Pyrinomonadaceae bacterium]
MAINLNKYSFEQWVAFVFDHAVSQSGEKKWYWQDEWEHEADHSLMLEHLILLFRNPTFLLDTYSPEQLEQGFWFIHKPMGLFEEALRDTDLKWQLRKECILSMAGLFERLFAVNPLKDSACYMWWDLLISGYFGPWHTWDPLMVDDKDLQAQQAIFETLCRILKLESRECQKAALHGLGHLNHRLTEQTIEAFLNENPGLDEELKQYAIKSIKGEIQ